MIEPFLAYYTSICTSYDSARRDILLHGHRLCWSWHYEYIVPHGHFQVIVGCDIHIIDKLNLPPKPLERLSPYVAHSETFHRWIWFLRNLKLSLAADCGQGEHDEHALFQHWLHCQLAVLPRPTLIRDQQSDAGRISLDKPGIDELLAEKGTLYRGLSERYKPKLAEVGSGWLQVVPSHSMSTRLASIDVVRSDLAPFILQSCHVQDNPRRRTCGMLRNRRGSPHIW